MTDKYSLYSAPRRRRVLTLLGMYEVGDEVTVRHLSRVITAIERTTPVHRIDTDAYESAYNSLIQNHMPTLADAGLIGYDDARKTATVTKSTHDAVRELKEVQAALDD